MESFIASPYEFLSEYSKSCQFSSDFKLNALLADFFAEHPEIYQQIPVVQSETELGNHSPNTLIRFRVVPISFGEDQYVFLTYSSNGEQYTILNPTQKPSSSSDIQPLVDFKRTSFVCITVPHLSHWMISPENANQVNVHMSSGEDFDRFSSVKPLQALFQFFFDFDFIKGPVYELLCTLAEIEQAPSDHQLLSPFVYEYLRFNCFFALQIESIFSPLIQIDVAPTRSAILSFFSHFLGREIGEILLLWLVSSAVRKNELLSGIFSLNLIGFDQEASIAFTTFLQSVCTTLFKVDLTQSMLESRKLFPSVDMGIVNEQSVFGNGTRFVLLQYNALTDFLNPTGNLSLSFLQSVASFQNYSIKFDGTPVNIPSSNPVLVLSHDISLINCDVALLSPVKTIPMLDILDEDFTALKFYTENMRFNSTSVGEEMTDFIQNRLVEVMRAFPRVSQASLHLIMTINHLLCVSFGFEHGTPEIFDHALELFSYIHRNHVESA